MSQRPSPSSRRLVSLVLPVYNEALSLRKLHGAITEVMAGRDEDYELVFVDDGSSDDSFRVLEELHGEDDHVRVVRFRRNFGKAAAYSAGFEAAQGEIVVTLDTDLQDDPAEIPLFLEKIDEGNDMVIGWKHGGKGALDKSLPSRFFNFVVRRLTGIQLHDFNCPFKAYRKEVLNEIHVYGELHRYIPVLASARGFKLAEIKISNRDRQHGHSHYGMERYIRGMLDLLTVIFLTRFARRPMHLLAAGGLVAVGLGTTILSVLIGGHFLLKLGVLTDPGWNIHDRPAISLGILLVIVGIQFLVSGLLAELFVIGWTANGGDDGYSIREHLTGRRKRPEASIELLPGGERTVGGRDR